MTGLEATNLAHRYGARVGLEPVSFSFGAPTAIAVTGANGSGKSTLLRIMAGLLRPSAGACRLTVAGRAASREEHRASVGFASPDLAFYDELTVAENLTFAANARGDRDAATSVRAALDRVGLGSRANDRVAALSSGMKQRLRLAFALMHAPGVLLLDEPSSHLDDDGRAALARIVADERQKRIVVIATNDETEGRLADQRIELRGRGLGHSA
ncbi:MAG: ABC transporter ATP-binding protein [Candidatus Eisenbacteria bacterium]|uniref:ABC transporter ATP-binding protein n=1 Tax=Eiseniibacteriota bacterium TaxID=2212470 RepID=A0A9D6LA14_UNCEI|nr:ABC transporter ATP-binding protein [Candidatus Eisenbacteria bacterium]MBI3540345.1 ABC transporter ATP-binding protein [Candidatus Eisenbacteria bacterium]